jgi:hypothetical protein
MYGILFFNFFTLKLNDASLDPNKNWRHQFYPKLDIETLETLAARPDPKTDPDQPHFLNYSIPIGICFQNLWPPVLTLTRTGATNLFPKLLTWRRNWRMSPNPK